MCDPGIAAKRIWHHNDSQGQILALTFSEKSFKPLKLFPFRPAAGGGITSTPDLHQHEGERVFQELPSSKHGTCKTVKARFWLGLSGKSSETFWMVHFR